MISLNKHQTLSSTLCTKTKPSNTARMSPRLHSSKKFLHHQDSDCSIPESFELDIDESTLGLGRNGHHIAIQNPPSAERALLEMRSVRVSKPKFKIQPSLRLEPKHIFVCQSLKTETKVVSESTQVLQISSKATPLTLCERLKEALKFYDQEATKCYTSDTGGVNQTNCVLSVGKMRKRMVMLPKPLGDVEEAHERRSNLSSYDGLDSCQASRYEQCGEQTAEMESSQSISIARFSWME
jgi:hypothetical protein